MPKPVEQQRVERSRSRRRPTIAARIASRTGQPSLTQSTPTMRRGEAADRADREVDLAHHQDADDAERDDADGRAIEQQVDEVVRRQEDRVEALEHGPDDRRGPTTTGSEPRSPERTRSTKARIAPPTPAACLTRSSLRSSSGAGALRWSRAHGCASCAGAALAPAVRPARRDTALSVAPVIALTSSWFEASG